MKRFHLHIVVKNIEKSVGFYSKLFDQSPTKRYEDYAKWMLENPSINFAISSRGHDVGVNHLGFQVDTVDELSKMKNFAENATQGMVLDQGQASCCYAKSEKHWSLDPQGIAWENFLTSTDEDEFGNDNNGDSDQAAACCIPLHQSKNNLVRTRNSCCVSNDSLGNGANCCV